MELDFLEIPLPNEIPDRDRSSNKSSTSRAGASTSTAVENLLSQNEDLMARLKVNLRRMSQLEDENTKLKEALQTLERREASFDDQILIYKEKDSMWKAKVDGLEKDRDIALEKSKAHEELNQKLNSELERFQRYHERIQTQVKPYIEQLKDFSRSMEEKNQDLDRRLVQKETAIRDLRNQIMELAKNSKQQIEFAEKKWHESTEVYEKAMASMRAELEHYQIIFPELESKAKRLDKALARQDELENTVIELERQIREQQEAHIASRTAEQNELRELRSEVVRLRLESQSLREHVLTDRKEIEQKQEQLRAQQEQLDSLRYMWTAKNEECDKLRAAMTALEKLNVELSTEVNRRRLEN